MVMLYKCQNSGNTTILCENQNIHKKDILHAPKIAKNLMSVSKLTIDNNVLVEFHSQACFVKDKVIRRTLLQGKIKEGMYELKDLKSSKSMNTSQAYLNVKEF